MSKVSAVSSLRRARVTPARLAALVLAVGSLTLALGAATANASLLSPVSSFGSQGSGAGQLNTPVGVAVQASSGNVFVADPGNARVDEFGPRGAFVAAWGWGVADGKAKSEVCTSNCQAGIPGSGPGQFSDPTSIAVGNSGGASAGKVYVGDQGNNVVEKFGDDGSFISSNNGSTAPQGGFSSLIGVSVDQGGNLWTADANSNNITEFDPHGNFVRQWTDPFASTLAIAVDSTHNAVYLIRGAEETERFTLDGKNETVIDNVFTGLALGLDPGTGNLYVDHSSSVSIFDHNGLLVDSLTLSTTNSQGLAFRSSGPGNPTGQRDLYVSDLSANNVTIYGPPSTPGPPLVTAESATGTGATTATLHAAIAPLGNDTTCTFQLVSSANFLASGYTNATSLPCTPADLGSSFTYQVASANITGLTVGTFYHFRVVATNSAGTTNGADTTFQAGPGDWTPTFRCPVDDPAMLATTGGTLGLFGGGAGTTGICLGSNSTHGSITIGNISTPTGNTNLQVGLVLDNSTANFSIIAPAGGALVADPVQLTVAGQTVTATAQSAGTPSNFNFIAGIRLGTPIITLPIKIHLESSTLPLGPSCFIGSNQNPIVLNPVNTDLSNAMLKFESFDPNGTPDPSGPLETIVVSGAVQGDDTFAVPGATGCGTNDSLDAAVNAVAGLPSPSGSNHLVLDDASSALAIPMSVSTGVVLTGQQFAADWHVVFG